MLSPSRLSSRPRGTAPAWTLLVPVAPEVAALRIARSINLPKRRLFGLLKTQREFVGVVEGLEFEIWERQARAVHAVGRVRGVRNGSRIEASFAMPTRTRVMIGAFFVLFVPATTAIAASRSQGFGLDSLIVLATGTLAVVALFALSAVRQRRDLSAFIAQVFAAASE